MDNLIPIYKVYVQINSVGKITAINSSAFLSDITDWTQIDEGSGDKFAHAQGDYFDKPLIDENGCYNYKLVDGKPTERTITEKHAEVAVRPAPQPTAEQKQLAAMTLNQAQMAATITALQQSNAALMLKLAGGK